MFEKYHRRNPISPQQALKLAIELFARNKCVHEDIKWGHVALLPEISTDERKVTNMIPILIDLCRLI